MIGACLQIVPGTTLLTLGIHCGDHPTNGKSSDDQPNDYGQEEIGGALAFIVDNAFLISVIIVSGSIHIAVNGRAVLIGVKIGGKVIQPGVKAEIIAVMGEKGPYLHHK